MVYLLYIIRQTKMDDTCRFDMGKRLEPLDETQRRLSQQSLEITGISELCVAIKSLEKSLKLHSQAVTKTAAGSKEKVSKQSAK